MRSVLVGFAITYSCDPQPESIDESYHPKKPIAFSHSTHAAFDCKVCHSSKGKSTSGDLPTVNVCANCHHSDGKITIDSNYFTTDL